MRPLSFSILTQTARRLPASLQLRVPPLRASEQFLFDHIPRTGGTYFASILSELVGTTCENFDTGREYAEDNKDEIQRLDKFDVIVGHMRLDTIKAFHRIRPRHVISLVRDPVAQVESTYKFWRNNVTLDLPHVNLAKGLSFGEFIRRPEVRMAVDNPMTRHFFSLWDIDKLDATESTQAMAVKMSDSYAFLGVTERMEETVLAFTKSFRTRKSRTKVEKIDRNESKGYLASSSEDICFLRKMNQLDYAIYKHVNLRLNSILYGDSRSAFSEETGCKDYSTCISLK